MKTETKPKELSAGELTKQAMKILDERGCEVWRSNNIAVRGRAFIGRKGVSDIIGFHRTTGVLVATEVKKNGDRLKPDQEVFLTQVKLAGGLALIATQSGPSVKLEEY